MHLDGPGRDEQRLGDVAIRHPLGGHRCDATLARRERLDTRERARARSRAGGDQLLVGALTERACFTLPRQLEAGTQQVASLAALAGSPQRRA